MEEDELLKIERAINYCNINISLERERILRKKFEIFGYKQSKTQNKSQLKLLHEKRLDILHRLITKQVSYSNHK